MPHDLLAQLQSTLSGTYALERELGGGGMSRVFIAEEKSLGRQVVVKVLPPEMSAGVSIDRFKREIALAARLQHPHIVPLLAAGDAGGVPYFTMPLIEGESLRARLAGEGELPVSEGLRILREVASALHYAHDKGIVHRDIKPDNILLSGGSAMVSDFGVAKALSESNVTTGGTVTSLGVAMGTPAYMSPEQATASPNLDARVDIYAFGATAYELFVGRPPFHGRSAPATLSAQVNEVPESITKLRTNLPPALAALIMRCLEKRPADRPQSAEDIVHALDAITTPSGGTQPTNALLSSEAATTLLPPAQLKRRVLPVAAAAIVVVAVVAWAIGRGGGAPPAPARAAADEKSIVVLPFVDEAGDTAREYVGEGIADEISSALGRLPGVIVKARSSAAAFKGSSLTPQQVGDSLRVASVLTGRIRRAGNRARITAELVNVATGNSIWTASFPAEFKDLFAAEEQIARAIASELKVTLVANTQLTRAATANPQAHDLYMQARFYMVKYTERDLRHALALFEQAVALDPKYAAAWAGIADVWGWLADDFIPSKEAYPHSRTAALRALALDPNAPEALSSFATELYWGEWKPDSAYRVAARARAINPNSPPVWLALYWLYLHRNQNDSVLVAVRHLQNLNPLDPIPVTFACEALQRQGDLAAAERECLRALSIEPNYTPVLPRLAEVLAGRKMYDSALKLIAAPANANQLARANLYRVWGRDADARREFQAAETDARGRYRRAIWFLRAAAGLGDIEATVRWGEAAFAQHDVGLINPALTDGWPESVKRDSRVQALLARIGAAKRAAEKTM